ncbi:MAG: anti-sigma factor family protein [Phototrophicaceae bacterium]
MAARPPDTDHDLLSAYLDSALTADEQRALEARLQAEPALQRQLDELRALVALLRGLPTRPAPRDFTLTRAMVNQPIRFPFVSLVSAAAAVICIALGVGLLRSASLQIANTAPAAVALQSSPAAPVELFTVQVSQSAMPTQTISATAAIFAQQANPDPTQVMREVQNFQSVAASPAPTQAISALQRAMPAQSTDPEGLTDSTTANDAIAQGQSELEMAESPLPADAADSNMADAAASSANAPVPESASGSAEATTFSNGFSASPTVTDERRDRVAIPSTSIAPEVAPPSAIQFNEVAPTDNGSLTSTATPPSVQKAPQSGRIPPQAYAIGLIVLGGLLLIIAVWRWRRR